MAMYLAEVPIYTIMCIGRWISDASLQYLRKHVQEFTVDKELSLEDLMTLGEMQKNLCPDLLIPTTATKPSGLPLQFTTKATYNLWLQRLALLGESFRSGVLGISFKEV
eukprot:13421896-Ditylum_brightwellii.AAC.1